jgi:hypothetical protein
MAGNWLPAQLLPRNRRSALVAGLARPAIAFYGKYVLDYKFVLGFICGFYFRIVSARVQVGLAGSGRGGEARRRRMTDG